MVSDRPARAMRSTGETWVSSNSEVEVTQPSRDLSGYVKGMSAPLGELRQTPACQ